ncbi:MAG: parallel beta-helix repeat protein [Acidimicrobiales bacterium]
MTSYAASVRNSGWEKFVGLVLSLVLLAACSGGTSEAVTPVDEPLPSSVEEQCQAGAVRVADRLQEFLADFDDLSPEEFLAQDEIEGLTGFQNDVAQVISSTTNQSSTLCDLNGLQAFVDRELGVVSEQGLLASYVVSTIRFGGSLEVADVELGPDDDIGAVLSLLDNGSSVRLMPGVFEVDISLLVQRDVVIVGAGQAESILRSSSPDAAFAVFGEGKLTLRELTIEHVGEASASVILAFGAPVDLERVTLRGATNDDETTGGNGLLLSSGVVNEEGVTTQASPGSGQVEPSRIVDSEITKNSIAGIAITGDLAPLIANNLISQNVLCGLCFLDESGGQVTNNTVVENEFGIQMGDASSPIISGNMVRDNNVAGMVLLGVTTAIITKNSVTDNGEVGIAVQEAAAPKISQNTIERQPFGVTVGGSSTAVFTSNTISESEVAMQVAEDAVPMVSDNQLIDNTNIAMLHRDASSGVFERNVIRGDQAVGVLVEGTASPMISEVTVEGSEVSVSYREAGAGTLSNSTFDAPAIAVQVEDRAAPEIADNAILRPSAAGIVVRSTGAVVVRGNTIDEPETLGIGTAGEAIALVEDNIVRGGESAASIVGQSAPEFVNNTFEGQAVAIQVGDQATPIIRENTITDAAGAGIVFRDEAAGEATQNTILNPLSVGIQIVGEAMPRLAENVVIADLQTDPEIDPETAPETDPELAAETADLDPESTVGILYAGDSGGELVANQVLGFVIGIQVSENAGPDMVENTVDGGVSAGVGFLFRDTATGSAQLNRTAGHSIGFQISDAASPELIDNTVEQVIDVSFLLQGDASPRLDGNTCPAAVPGIGVLEEATPDLGTNLCQVAYG